MIPGSYDFTIERGATEPVTIRLKTQVSGSDVRTPLDLTGATVTLTITPGPFADGAPITKSWIDGGADRSGARRGMPRWRWRNSPFLTRLFLARRALAVVIFAACLAALAQVSPIA